MGNRIKMLLIPDFAIISQRVMTQEGEREAAILICGEKILDVISISEIPSTECKLESPISNTPYKVLNGIDSIIQPSRYIQIA